jgi:cellulose synthase/poly-beta-1,6-N-acetylglucosamine synthase-like glycosyltransferase
MDFFSHAVVAAGAMGAGFPINTNANNFAVRKRHFEEVQGFGRVASIVSGDDDLLLQSVSRLRGVSVRYAMAPKSAVTTEPTPSLKTLWEQRKRWSSKTVYYNRAQTLYLSGIFIYYALILLGFLLSPFFSAFFVPVASAFLFKTAMDFFLAFSGMVRFRKFSVLPWFFPLALFHIPLIVSACCFGIFGKFTWKDGRVKKKLGS